ncbi:hypothetical protein FIV42_25440 [Persicimonas caeni]|uniref:Nucleotidyltransferase family protein n=1 Tax=Persicimonas caeni TaxID=2292766 RepID=A0A4Y6Q078_PERCE|nr:hypothetical protein [Persicimonas caeni]QDG53964.1 hypothetical protein FIV42_25440 [Persicimonas caeni]QED35185.1 hypothetical protein FRD00_25435 [Persicimonas caeni]
MLLDHDVDFILVGALSAVLQGAPVMTVDVDIVHQRTEENIDALVEALDALDAQFRGPPGKRLEPTREHLASTGHQLLTTIYGPLDLLGTIEHGLTYEQLLGDSIDVEFDGHRLHVLSLAKYVELKEESSLPKDRARIPVLRETLEMQKNAEREDSDEGQ